MARSGYRESRENFRAVQEYFGVLESSGMLEAFCSQNGLDAGEARGILERFARIDELVDECNDRFVRERMLKEQEYLDHILDAIDPSVRLDAVSYTHLDVYKRQVISASTGASAAWTPGRRASMCAGCRP